MDIPGRKKPGFSQPFGNCKAPFSLWTWQKMELEEKNFVMYKMMTTLNAHLGIPRNPCVIHGAQEQVWDINRAQWKLSKAACSVERSCQKQSLFQGFMGFDKFQVGWEDRRSPSSWQSHRKMKNLFPSVCLTWFPLKTWIWLVLVTGKPSCSCSGEFCTLGRV